MTSIDEILFNQELPYSLPNSKKLRKTITDRFGNIKCFVLRPQYHRYSPLREIVFTKFGVGFVHTGTFYEVKIPYSFLCGIKCTMNNEFNCELYNKYKDLIISVDNDILIKEKETLEVQKEQLQMKNTQLENKLKKEQQKNEVLVDLLYSQKKENTEISSDTKYQHLLEMFNEQSKQIANLINENEELKNSKDSCLICYETTEVRYICRPCNHILNIHAKCLIRATRCPICNQTTTTREQVYFS